MTQIYPFLISVVCGVGIGMVFDLFRLHRKKYNVNTIFLTIQDILFWMFFAFVVCYFTFHVNDGIFRAFEFLGFGIGIIIYMKLLSKIFNTAFRFIWKITSAAAFWLLKVGLFPIMLLMKPLGLIIKLIKKFLKHERNKFEKNRERFRRFSKRI